MKQTINLGAYGWRHDHWLKSFYPDDLPVEGDDDWRLAYYSNEPDAVIVPADYWQEREFIDCGDWLDSVHADFQFYVECRGDMMNYVSLDDMAASLNRLKPQISALVILQHDQPGAEESAEWFIELADSLDVDVIGGEKSIWRPDENQNEQQVSSLALMVDELLDLRASKVVIEKFIAQINGDETDTREATIIIDHPRLQPGNLGKLRAVLDVMGY